MKVHPHSRLPAAFTRGARISISETQTAWDLGVVIDSQLTLFAQVTAVCRSGYHQLRQLYTTARQIHAI